MGSVKLFEDFLNEKNMLVVINGEDTSHAVNFRLSYRYGQGGILAMAATSKDLDKLIASNQSETAIGKDIEDMINKQLKKFRAGFTVEQDHGYQGAGYSFYLNIDDMLKKLNKS